MCWHLVQAEKYETGIRRCILCVRRLQAGQTETCPGGNCHRGSAAVESLCLCPPPFPARVQQPHVHRLKDRHQALHEGKITGAEYFTKRERAGGMGRDNLKINHKFLLP